MKVIDLFEQEQQIGVSVFQQGTDSSYLDFQVFAWPDPNNTIADQSEQLNQTLENDQEYERFLEILQRSGRHSRRVRNITVFGPFSHISELVG